MTYPTQSINLTFSSVLPASITFAASLGINLGSVVIIVLPCALCVTLYTKVVAVVVSADDENIGSVDGDEVLQIYASSENAELDRPVKLLKGFKRVSVKAGESVSSKVEIDLEDIKFYNAETGEWELDNSYTILAGTNSQNAKPVGRVEF